MSLFTDECLELLKQIEKWARFGEKERVLALLRKQQRDIRLMASRTIMVSTPPPTAEEGPSS